MEEGRREEEGGRERLVCTLGERKRWRGRERESEKSDIRQNN